jgi:hypothetical protein
MKKTALFALLFVTSNTLFGQGQVPPPEVKPEPNPKNNYSKYNSATFGTQGGKSVTNKAASILVYNYNQVSFTNRLFLSSYAEYYNDRNNLFLSNYMTAQAFMNYKLPRLFVVGMGYRFNNNFQINQSQNFLQFKVEKTFTWK